MNVVQQAAIERAEQYASEALAAAKIGDWDLMLTKERATRRATQWARTANFMQSNQQEAI